MKTMKSKLATLTVIGLVACGVTVIPSAFADEAPGATPPAADAPAAAPADAAQAPVAAPSTDSAPPAEATATTEQAETPAASAAANEAPVMVENHPAEKHEDVIPLIQFQDVQLTTAIENLARQASINYILDPKVGFGQLDDRGQVRPQPNISIRWENVTASQALTALLQNHGLQLVMDNKTRIARITVKDPAAPEPLQTKVIQLKYATTTNIVSAVQGTLTDKRAKVIGDRRTSQLVVLATEKEQDAVEKLVEKLDTATKQVLIEAKLLETSTNPKSVKGIDWSGTLAAQKFTFGNNATEGTPSQSLPNYDANGNITSYTYIPGNPGGILSDPKVLANTANGFNPATAFLNADGVSAVLSFLNDTSDARIIATPRAVTLDNETAHLSVVRSEPIFKVQASTQNTTGGSDVTYTNLGVILDVTPRISANNFVNLKVIPEVSRVFAVRTRTVAGTVNQADAYDLRRIDTSVMIPSGNTLVLGGLVADDTRNGNTKVPILGDIPFIGYAFRHDSKSRDQGNLMIFITPTIVQDSDYQPAPNSGDYLKIKPKDQSEKEWGAWDSGKPKDWSKPKNQELFN
jgi:type II secretory pathway component GspD/PulD (secretin)